MHRYKIFLISGETVEVEAESVKVMTDSLGKVNRYDFIKDDAAPVCMIKPSAIFYCDYIMGWAQLPEEVETGHWIMHQDHRECSQCGIYFLKDMPRNSYCANCGAKNLVRENRCGWNST